MKKIFYIDLFSGAGGTTTGIHLTNIENLSVVACVNHDRLAIESHKANHPECAHFIEDVRNHKVVIKLKMLVDKLRNEHPGCIIIIWASLECTNFSNAKGGLPRDGDSRTLANALYQTFDPVSGDYIDSPSYIQLLDADYIMIENVREFLSWGPLDKNGKPESKDKGRDYLKWRAAIEALGYDYEHRFLNSADFGAYTSRVRYFSQFAKRGLPITWPEPTHASKPIEHGLFSSEKKWNPVKDVLDLDDEGESIFNRKKPLVDGTLKRIYAGLIKFVAGGTDKWLLKYNSVNQNGYHNPPGISEPCPTVATQGRLGLVKVAFISKYFSGKPMQKVISIDGPAGTIKTIDGQSLVQTFLTSYYKNGSAHSTDKPAPTLTTKDRLSSVFIDQQYGQGKPASIEQPAGTLTQIPKLNMVKVQPWVMHTNFSNVGQSIEQPCAVITANRKHHYMNPSWSGHFHQINTPGPVVIARQDKSPLYLLGYSFGQGSIPIYENDSLVIVAIKEFMALYGISDIKMRMLKIIELKRIQGFPEDYVLKGTQTEQKKFIGNAVVPDVAKALALANYAAINKIRVAI